MAMSSLRFSRVEQITKSRCCQVVGLAVVQLSSCFIVIFIRLVYLSQFESCLIGVGVLQGIPYVITSLVIVLVMDKRNWGLS